MRAVLRGVAGCPRRRGGGRPGKRAEAQGKAFPGEEKTPFRERSSSNAMMSSATEAQDRMETLCMCGDGRLTFKRRHP